MEWLSVIIMNCMLNWRFGGSNGHEKRMKYQMRMECGGKTEISGWWILLGFGTEDDFVW